MKKIFVSVAFLVCALPLLACGKVENHDTVSCMNNVASIRSDVGSGSMSLSEGISATKKLEKDCLGTGNFEASLSDFYITTGKFSLARKYIELGLKVEDSDKTVFYESLYEINAKESLDGDNEALARDLIARNDPIGRLLLGKYLAAEGSIPDAIQNLELARKSGLPELSYASDRLLVVLYWVTKDYAGVVRAFDNADKYSEAYIYRDIDEPKFAAIANYLVGDAVRSKAILDKLLVAHPQAATDRHVEMLKRDLSVALK